MFVFLLSCKQTQIWLRSIIACYMLDFHELYKQRGKNGFSTTILLSKKIMST